MICTSMIHRVSISENTMERLKRYVREKVSPYAAETLGDSGRYSFTVEDIVLDLLRKEGF